MNKTMRALALSVGMLAAGAAFAQVPILSATVEAVDWIANVSDQPAVVSGNGTVAQSAITVPANRTLRLTDITVDLRRMNTSTHPCFFEIWRGTPTQPVALAWQRARLFNSATYDRSWVMGPQFGPGEVVWIVTRVDPTGLGLRTCTRDDPNVAGELRFALRGYLIK